MIQSTGKAAFPRLEYDLTEDEIFDILTIIYTKIVYQRIESQNSQNKALFLTESTKYIREAAKWLKCGEKRGLLLSGQSGNGKTTLACTICSFVSIYFNEVNNFRSLIKNQNKYHFDGEIPYTSARLIELYGTQSFTNLTQSRCLYVDDLGREPKNYGYAHPAIEEIINFRHKNIMDTIITTNIAPAEIAKTYGMPVADRMIELCCMIKVNLPSFRK